MNSFQSRAEGIKNLLADLAPQLIGIAQLLLRGSEGLLDPLLDNSRRPQVDRSDGAIGLEDKGEIARFAPTVSPWLLAIKRLIALIFNQGACRWKRSSHLLNFNDAWLKFR